MMHQNTFHQRLSPSSRSSNSNVASSSTKSRKKTQVPKKSTKKRGVYVDVKRTDTSLVSQGHNQNNLIRSHLAHIPNVNRILIASVLDVLSKASTVTCLAGPEQTPSKRTLIPRIINKNTTKDNNIDITTEDKILISKTSNKIETKPYKKESQPIIILEPRRNISQSSSVIIKRSTTTHSKPKHTNESRIKTMESYKQEKSDPVPSILVSKIAERKEKIVEKLLLDLLETSLSAYNVVSDYKTPQDSVIYLNDVTGYKKGSTATRNIGDKGYNDDRIYDNYVNPNSTNRRVKPIAKEKHSFMSEKSKIYYKSYLAKQQQKMQSSKKPKKHNLLNILKRDLARESHTDEEPTSFFEALKVMAKNRDKNSKGFNFYEAYTSSDSPDDAESKFRRRKLLSARKRNRRRNGNPDTEEYIHKYVQPMSPMSEILEDGTESSHSLQVQEM